jgi:23S rRNA pseudouridine2605 synthase
MRLNQFLASAGLGSRRSVESLIREGRVQINGQPASLAMRVDPDSDHVLCDGKAVRPPAHHSYILLHKPRGYTVTRTDAHATRSVYEIVPRKWRRLAYVGRLDLDSEGLLLFTDDGDLTFRLLRPSYGIDREYHVQVGGVPKASALTQMVKGITLEDGREARAVSASFAPRGRAGGMLTLVLREGKKREVRHMCAAALLTVKKLTRVRFGPVTLGRMSPGETRELLPAEVEALHEAVGLAKK